MIEHGKHEEKNKGLTSVLFVLVIFGHVSVVIILDNLATCSFVPLLLG